MRYQNICLKKSTYVRPPPIEARYICHNTKIIRGILARSNNLQFEPSLHPATRKEQRRSNHHGDAAEHLHAQVLAIHARQQGTRDRASRQPRKGDDKVHRPRSDADIVDIGDLRDARGGDGDEGAGGKAV